MHLRLATEDDYIQYYRWIRVIFSIIFSGERPTEERIKRPRVVKVYPNHLSEEQKKRRMARDKLKWLRRNYEYSFENFQKKVSKKEIFVIEQSIGEIVGYIDARSAQKGQLRIYDWALSGEYQEIDIMKDIINQFQKEYAKKRSVYILCPMHGDERAYKLLTSLGFVYEHLCFYLSP